MEWVLFMCSDCDTNDGVVIVQLADGASRDASCAIDYCPGCGSYLSMLNTGKVEVDGNALALLRMRGQDG